MPFYSGWALKSNNFGWLDNEVTASPLKFTMGSTYFYTLSPLVCFNSSIWCMEWDCLGLCLLFWLQLQICQVDLWTDLSIYDRGISECTFAIGVEVQNVQCSSLIRKPVILAVWYEKSRCYDGAHRLRQWCAQEMPIQLQWVWESQLGLTIVYRRYRLVCILLESSQIPVRSGSAKWQSLVDVPKDSSNVRSELHVVSLKMICQMRGLRPYYTSIYIDPTIHPSYWNHLELATETLTRDKAPILYHFECSCNLTALAALSCILVVDSVNPFSSAVWRTVHFSVLTARGQYISVGSQGRPVSFCRCAVYWRYSSNYWTATSLVKKKQKNSFCLYNIVFSGVFLWGKQTNWSRCIHCIQTEVTVAKFENPVHECRNDAPLPPYSKKSIVADLDF